MAVKFEESMKSHQISFECLTLDRVLGKVGNLSLYKKVVDKLREVIAIFLEVNLCFDVFSLLSVTL